MLSIDALRFSYPEFRLEVPSLSVEEGERAAIVGPSGSGKTTLLNLVAGLFLPEAGRIRIGETEISSLSDRARRTFRARRIGFVFQTFALLDYLTARENILYPFRVGSGLSLDQAARDRAQALADRCGIGGKLDRRPGALSQGEQQRVAICRALVTRPGLILADEATGNLDPATKTLILDLLFDRAAEEGATVLAVTHDHDLLARFDRVIDFAQFRAGRGAGA
ncbi:ABC transporter ATP-binding protein [Histidinibacterium lentulum]|uniref:ABC transporter ATP-binding protein n=1 Tax=Histidinibacterium lentulum TaxID=2480588 RepID=A0A3N2R882_9RHOB|nr:ABC transporter ATP-binding protein [Histidinibacterium lentulum]ROU03702.1 ABC transporter ATP-binding protein [Histidinibacterium lentulum]